MATIDEDLINELGSSPHRTTTEEGTVEERPIREVIEADRYATKKAASDKVPWGVRMACIKPGGTTPGRTT